MPAIFSIIIIIIIIIVIVVAFKGARYSSLVRAFAHGAMGHRIDTSWGESIELFLDPASAPQLV